MKHNKKIAGFPLFIIIYTLTGLVAIALGLWWFYDFIKCYENSLPHHKIEAYISSADVNAFITSNSNLKVTEFETVDMIATQLYSIDPNTELTYKRAGGEYTESAPVYIIKNNDISIAKVTLKKDIKTAKYNFPTWKIDNVESLLQSERLFDAEIYVPNGVTPKINGIEVPQKYLTESDIELSDLKTAYKYLEGLPKLKKYRVTGLNLKPQVTAEKGLSELEAEVKGNAYYFRPADSQALKEEHSEMVLAMEKAYISYMIDEFDATAENFARLAKYLESGSKAYSMLGNLSVSWNRPYDAREDILLSAEHFTKYGSDCFACNMVFKIKLTSNNTVNEYKGNIRWTFVRTENGWKAVQMTIEDDF